MSSPFSDSDIHAALPTEDQSVLQALPLSEVSQWARTRIQEYESRLAALEGEGDASAEGSINDIKSHILILRRVYNLGLPISRPPNEIVVKFLIQSGSSTIIDIVRRSHVCSRWRTILLARHTLWVNTICIEPIELATAYDMGVFRAGLARSGELPLELFLDSYFDKAWPELVDHRGRLTELRVHFRSLEDVAVFQEAAHSGMPKLYSLWTSHEYAISDCPAFTLEQHSFPALRHYTVQRSPIAPCSILSSLEMLKISYVDLTLEMLTDIIARCATNLKVLSLDDVLSSDTPVDEPIPIPHVAMPLLREFVIFHQEFDEHYPYLLAIPESISPGACVSLFLFMGAPVPDQLSTDFPGISSAPFIDRLCLERHAPDIFVPTAIMMRGFVQTHQRLCLMFNPLSPKRMRHSSNPLLRVPASTLAMNFAEELQVNECEALMKELQSVRCLELPHTCWTPYKHSFAASFLQIHWAHADELTLIWIVGIRRNDTSFVDARTELEGLVDILRRHNDSEGSSIRLLELYAVQGNLRWKPYVGINQEHMNAPLCAQVVQPVLAKLQGLVSIVRVC